MTPMPNAPRTPLKSFRIPEDLYREAQQLAADEGQSVSDVSSDPHNPIGIS